MAKEWILNSATNRFQLNFSRNIGKVSAEIRKCSPKTLDEWEEYYYRNVRSKEHIIELGRKLYTKISEVLQAEIESITEEDCVEYIRTLVINRTYDGYIAEKQTVYGQLQESLGVKIEPAPDEWDRLYNVDFFIKVRDKFIGLQIKPVTFEHAPEFASKWRDAYKESHEKFSKKFGGSVFIVLSVKKGDKKVIFNTGVIDEIKEEIENLWLS